MQFWPILCSVNNSKPVIVAVFLGKAKPNSAESFLADFIKVFQQLNTDGFVCSDCAPNTDSASDNIMAIALYRSWQFDRSNLGVKYDFDKIQDGGLAEVALS